MLKSVYVIHVACASYLLYLMNSCFTIGIHTNEDEEDKLDSRQRQYLSTILPPPHSLTAVKKVLVSLTTPGIVIPRSEVALTNLVASYCKFNESVNPRDVIEQLLKLGCIQLSSNSQSVRSASHRLLSRLHTHCFLSLSPVSVVVNR